MNGKRKRRSTYPWRVQWILDQLAAGKVLCKYLHQKPGNLGTEERYFFEPGGYPISTAQVHKAFSFGLLKPRGDGFFGDSQTYERARP